MQENVIRALQEEGERRQQAISLIEQGLGLLKDGGGLTVVEGGGGLPTPVPGATYQPGGYIPIVIAILREAGKPMKVADIVTVMQEQARFRFRPRQRLRQAVERSVWLEVTKRKRPRLKRVGKEGQSSYWMTELGLGKGEKDKQRTA